MSSLLPNASPIYLDTELAMSQIGDVETMNSMLQMLEESLARDLPLIASLLQQGDVPAANRLLHALKGFIPIFCPEALSTHVAEVEGLSKQGPNPSLVPAYAALQPQLATLLSEVSAYLRANGMTV
jgi:HPt (histidine-containing phosphotransfer) domain-containing protein